MYHSPAAVFVTITLPWAVGMVSTRDTRNQPTAGSTAPAAEPVPAAPSRQVAAIRRQKPSAPSGIGLAARLN
jgi:hypothetical protein